MTHDKYPVPVMLVAGYLVGLAGSWIYDAIRSAWAWLCSEVKNW